MSRAYQLVFLGFCALFLSGKANAQVQVSFYTVVDLALRNSPQVRMSAADVQRAEAGLTESTDAYKPSVLVGSSLGYSYGFPVGQPSVANLGAQSLIFSFAQRQYVRSARATLQSAQLQLKDMRQQTILDAALNYIELSKVTRQIAALDQQNAYVHKLITIEEERVDAGLDSKVEFTKVRLAGAQVELKHIHLLNQAELLRARLAHLTGLAPADMTPSPQTIPDAPEIHLDSSLDGMAMDANSGVKAAYATAQSKFFTSRGDAQQTGRPTISFGLEYGRYAKFNNYNEYYLRFQHNNFNVGAEIEIPIFDAARKAKARTSSAEAAHAEAQANQFRDQTSEHILQLQKSLSELTAQEQVSELENELSQDQLDTVTAELQSGTGNPNQPQMTPKDEQQARIEERSRYVDMLDSKFQLTQAQLNLLRDLGRIEDWAKTVPQPNP